MALLKPSADQAYFGATEHPRGSRDEAARARCWEDRAMRTSPIARSLSRSGLSRVGRQVCIEAAAFLGQRALR